jgi:hypothetical protein
MKKALALVVFALALVVSASGEKKLCSTIHYPHSRYGCIADPKPRVALMTIDNSNYPLIRNSAV